jgi:Predicted membrane protein (DUF2127)
VDDCSCGRKDLLAIAAEQNAALPRAGLPRRFRFVRAGESGGRLVWLIALERSLRGLVLVAAGIYLVARAGSNFGDVANHLARRIELDPQRAWIRHRIAKLGRLRKHEVKVFGAGAIAYGVLELVEGGGLSTASVGPSG